jgi:hypothetical protein
MAYALARSKDEAYFHHEGHEEHEVRKKRIGRKERKKDSEL